MPAFLPFERDGTRVYAGFWRRTGAHIIDALVVVPITFGIHSLETSVASSITLHVVTSVLALAYCLVGHARWGATLGKFAMGVRVTHTDGRAISWKHATLRSSVELAVTPLFVLAFVMAMFNIDAEAYFALNGIWERGVPLYAAHPTWFEPLYNGYMVWVWGQLLVLLTNKRRRSLHDMIASTVVINARFAQPSVR